MVKQGFLNLTQQEQARVQDAALSEFAENDFFAASLNRIIAKAKISKGSMYHYFHNKEALYLHILDLGMTRKTEYLSRALAELNQPLEELDFFNSIAFQMKVSLRFALDNPKFQMMAHNLVNMGKCPFKDSVMEKMNTQFDEYLAGMLDKALKQGELRTDVKRDFVLRILRFFLMNFTQMYPEIAAKKELDAEILVEEMEQLARFLQDGLRGKKGGDSG